MSIWEGISDFKLYIPDPKSQFPNRVDSVRDFDENRKQVVAGFKIAVHTFLAEKSLTLSAPKS
jgi:hypothetical protein